MSLLTKEEAAYNEVLVVKKRCNGSSIFNNSLTTITGETKETSPLSQSF